MPSRSLEQIEPFYSMYFDPEDRRLVAGGEPTEGRQPAEGCPEGVSEAKQLSVANGNHRTKRSQEASAPEVREKRPLWL